jgi:hypothetical protein
VCVGEEWFRRRNSTSLFTAACACLREALSPITPATNGPPPPHQFSFFRCSIQTMATLGKKK